MPESTSAPDLTPKEILRQLAESQAGYPADALSAALAAPDKVTPGLLAMLEVAADHAGDQAPGAMGHRHALVLLGAWREPRAFEILLKLLTLPSELVDHILGETLDHLLPRALAGTSQGRVEDLMLTVENDGLYDYCRIAALKALKILVLQGELGRETLIAFYHKLFMKLPKRPDAFPWDLLVREINELHPAELEQDIRAIFREGLINPYFLREEHMEVDLSRKPEDHLEAARLKPENRLIEDAPAEIRKFALYAEK